MEIETPEGAVSQQDIMNSQHQEYTNFIRGNTYKDQRTIFCIAHRGRTEKVEKHTCSKCKNTEDIKTSSYMGIDPIIIDSWDRIIKPINQISVRFFAIGYEVSDAYNKIIEMILSNKGVSDFPYILFLEDDIIAPFMPNSYGPLLELMRLMDKFDIAGALYWTKGMPSVPLIYGIPGDKDYPFVPRKDWKVGDIVECNGMGMGFTLFKTSIFKDPKVRDPDGKWFKTQAETNHNSGIVYTQDLYFMKKAVVEAGYKACVHTGVRAGHLDVATGEVY